MHPRDFLLKIASQLAHDLTSNQAIRDFTNSSDLIGAYAEATVRNLILRMVSPLRVSTGAIVYEKICPDDVPQIDTIIWAPCPVPAVFESGQFALVPRDSAMAFLEVKSSAYPGSSEKMAKNLNRQDELIIRYSFSDIPRQPQRSLGVVCVQRRDQRERDIDTLVREKRAVVLLSEREPGRLESNPNGMYHLVNFLAGVRLRANMMDGQFLVNWDQYADALE